MKLEVGKVYKNKSKIREVISIENNEITYKDNNSKISTCWITTFEDWVNKGAKSKLRETVSYEIIYTKQNGKEYVTTESIEDLKTAEKIALNRKHNLNYKDVKILETKTIESIISILE